MSITRFVFVGFDLLLYNLLSLSFTARPRPESYCDSNEIIDHGLLDVCLRRTNVCNSRLRSILPGMAGTLPQRTKTASTMGGGSVFNDKGNDMTSLIQRSPTTPVRTHARGRRSTLSHRKLVFYDPVAFRYLEEDDSTIVLARRERIRGYELYVVEQWACSRVHPTFAIATYTGDPNHSILVNVLAVPHEEQNWSKRLKIYYDAVSQFHAREEETPLGTLMVTNLSAFPSALTVISVPDGDVRKHREDFIVNENLKRMGCSGRAAMNLQPAPPSTVAKFHNLYSISENIPFKAAVMELVKLCQTALALYGKLNAIYADGLLCDITEKAIDDWWNDIGTDFHNVEPSDGKLGPTTVAALIGLLIGAYNRIRTTGVTVPKDVLDIPPMKRAIGHFQKANKMEKTRRLDRDTLDRIHRVTAKTANSEGWAIPRAVKSTVAELSGKGGEMVMGVIGANKEKVAISEVETLDVDKLAQLVPGAKMKWLWQGKALKTGRGDAVGMKGFDGLNGRVFSTDEQGNYVWTSANRQSIFDQDDADDANNHDKSGRGRFRGRLHRRHEDEAENKDATAELNVGRQSKEIGRPIDQTIRGTSSLYSRNSMDRPELDRPAFDLALANADPHAPAAPLLDRVHSKLQPASAGPDNADSEAVGHREQLRRANDAERDSAGRKRVRSELKHLHSELQTEVYQKFATEFDQQEPEIPILRRSKSSQQLREVDTPIAHELRLPRQLSFSLVESSILKFKCPQDEISGSKSRDQKATGPNSTSSSSTLQHQLLAQEVEAHELQNLTTSLLQIEASLMLQAESEVVQVERLDGDSRDHLTDLNNIYYARLDEYQALQATSRDLLSREKQSLQDGLTRVKMLEAKLDYELDALHSRMQEVEDGAAEFERNVLEIEERVDRLVRNNDRGTPGGGFVVQAVDSVQDRAIPWFRRLVRNFWSPSTSTSSSTPPPTPTSTSPSVPDN